MFGLGTLARVTRELREDLTAASERDPAARSVGRAEMLATYGGVQALLSHRVSHALHEAGVPVVPRALSNVTKVVTGIEIHPAARIGGGLFIDHGSGVVIGETAEVGDDVTIYQGVTLGGTGFQRGKRHPTVGHGSIIGAGAKLLGPIEVGERARVGANSVVIHDVPADVTVVGNPGHPVRVTAAGRRVRTPTGRTSRPGGGRHTGDGQPAQRPRGAGGRAHRPQARGRRGPADQPAPRARLDRRLAPQ